MPRYKLTLAYDGTDFHGWQRQFQHPALMPGAEQRFGPPGPDGRVELRTVQKVVVEAVRAVVREPVEVQGASRTDAGVHANGQTAAFSCSGGTEEVAESTEPAPRGIGWPAARGVEPLRRAINARLPADVDIRTVELAGDDFDPITHAILKRYTYTIYIAPERPLWQRRTAAHVRHRLDPARMSAAARLLEGEHDFAAFAAAGHGRQSTIRTVTACSVEPAPQTTRDPGETCIITVEGKGFLWNQVRIMAGTIVEAGRGAIDEDRIRAALDTGNRRLAGPTMPPEGLCLEWIRYV